MRPPRRVAVALALPLAAIGLCTLGTAGASAQGQATASMQVSAVVPRKCVVTTVPLVFGTYDPVQTNATAPGDAQSTITVACTKGTIVTIGIDNGTHSVGRMRRMDGGIMTFLTYELYKDSNRTERWGDTLGERYDGGLAPSRDPRAFIVYGRVPGGQDIQEGTYRDTVAVTVHF